MPLAGGAGFFLWLGTIRQAQRLLTDEGIRATARRRRARASFRGEYGLRGGLGARSDDEHAALDRASGKEVLARVCVTITMPSATSRALEN